MSAPSKVFDLFKTLGLSIVLAVLALFLANSKAHAAIESYIIVHALNPERIEIASIERVAADSVEIYDGDTLIGYGAHHNPDTYGQPIAISAGQHTIKAKFNGITKEMAITLAPNETEEIVFTFERTEFNLVSYLNSVKLDYKSELEKHYSLYEGVDVYEYRIPDDIHKDLIGEIHVVGNSSVKGNGVDIKAYLEYYIDGKNYRDRIVCESQLTGDLSQFTQANVYAFVCTDCHGQTEDGSRWSDVTIVPAQSFDNWFVQPHNYVDYYPGLIFARKDAPEIYQAVGPGDHVLEKLPARYAYRKAIWGHTGNGTEAPVTQGSPHAYGEADFPDGSVDWFMSSVPYDFYNSGFKYVVAVPLDKQVSQKDTTVVAEPINVANGNMFTTEKDIVIASTNLPLEFSRTYNSQDNFNGSFGYGWRSNFDITLSEQPDASVVEVDETGVYTIYTRNPDGSYTPSAGKYSQLTKNPDGTYQIIRKHGTKLLFNAQGLFTRIEDRNANAITIQRDSNGVIQEITDPSGRKLLFTANAQGKITQVKDPAGRLFKYEYDASGNLIKTIDPLNQETLFEYNSNYNLIRKTDANNHSLYFEYDSNDRAFHSWQDNHNNEVTLAFVPANKSTTVTDSLGSATKYEYNDYGLVTKITDAQGNTQAFAWDNSLNKISSTNQNDFTTVFTYDARGNLLTVKDALNNTTTLTYEPNFDFVSSVTDPLGSKTEYSYDAKGNLIQVKDALNNITTYSYDSLGRLIQAKDVKGNVTYFVYDTNSNLIQITDNQNHSTNFTYDILGNKLQVTDAQGKITKFTYDLLNRLIQIAYPDDSKATYVYDPVGNLISSTDQNGNTTSYAYDAIDRLIQVTDTQGNTTKYTYDTEGNRISITDAAGNTTQYSYDSLNRLIKTQDALGNQNLFSYDPGGNLIAKKDANGDTIKYTYDSLNRLIKKQYPNQTEETFSYDAKGALLTAANLNISYSYTYDPLSQLLSVADSNNRNISYVYDAAGNRVKMTTPEGKTVTYAYDSLNRLSSIIDTYNKATTYAYDSLSRRTKVTLPNQATASYTYDSLNDILSLVNKAQSSELISSYSYTYDKAGNRLSKQEPDIKTSYSYDSLYRLTQSTPTKLKDNGKEIEKKNRLETYIYDSVGNRLTSIKDSYSYNSLNQLLSTNKFAYEYDKNGNLIKKTETDEKDGKQKISTFTYDYENRLVKVEIQKENKLKIISFTYDPFDRRLSKTAQREEIKDEETDFDVQDSAEEEMSSRTTYYVYDFEDVILEYNQKGKVTARYTHGPGIDEPISIERNSKLYYYHYDGLGSVTELTDQKGKTIESYSYDSFGNLKRQGNKTKNSFTYTGREYDKEIGLYYYRNRYYDPKIGRFLTQDPLGMIDGPNLYNYVKNNSVNFMDPWGLNKQKKSKQVWDILNDQKVREILEFERQFGTREMLWKYFFGRAGVNTLVRLKDNRIIDLQYLIDSGWASKVVPVLLPEVLRFGWDTGRLLDKRLGSRLTDGSKGLSDKANYEGFKEGFKFYPYSPVKVRDLIHPDYLREIGFE